MYFIQGVGMFVCNMSNSDASASNTIVLSEGEVCRKFLWDGVSP